MGLFGDFFSGVGDVLGSFAGGVRDFVQDPAIQSIATGVLGQVLSSRPPIIQGTQPGPVGFPQFPQQQGPITLGSRPQFGTRPGLGGGQFINATGQIIRPTVGSAPAVFNPQTGMVVEQASLAGAGGAILRQLPGLLAGIAGGEAVELLLDGGGGGMVPGQLFTQASSQTVRPVHEITAIHPVTGRPVVWVNRGRPLLYSGDLGACKRVARVAGLANKRVSKVKTTARKVRRRR